MLNVASPMNMGISARKIAALANMNDQYFIINAVNSAENRTATKSTDLRFTSLRSPLNNLTPP